MLRLLPACIVLLIGSALYAQSGEMPATSSVADLPIGVRDGINYEAGDTSVTLALFAPGKSTVTLLGDFNNYAVGQQMGILHQKVLLEGTHILEFEQHKLRTLSGIYFIKVVSPLFTKTVHILIP